MLVFAVAAVKLGPDWAKVGKGFIPHISQNNPMLYCYFVIGLLGAAITPYEVYFYSSGGVEEEWTPKDIGMNQANAILRYGLGGTLSLALMVVGATVFLGHGISPQHPGTIALGAGDPSARSVCCSRSSQSCSRWVAPRSTQCSPARTTWRSSAAGRSPLALVLPALLALLLQMIQLLPLPVFVLVIVRSRAMCPGVVVGDRASPSPWRSSMVFPPARTPPLSRFVGPPSDYGRRLSRARAFCKRLDPSTWSPRLRTVSRRSAPLRRSTATATLSRRRSIPRACQEACVFLSR